MDLDLPAMELLQSGDESGLVSLMERHKEPVFRFVLRYVGNDADAADLTEETFYRVYAKASRFSPRAKVSTWIFAIAANVSRDFLRRRRRFPFQSSLDQRRDDDPDAGGTLMHDRVPSDIATPAEETQTNEAMAAIERAIQTLPDKLRFPFVFCVLEDHSYDECAAIIGSTRKTVETRIYRARNRLRDLLVG